MNTNRTIWSGRGAIEIALLTAVIAAGAFLFIFNPAQYRLYPACTFHELTGLQCPGCGATRAVYELLHGNIGVAIALNPLLIAMLPVPAWIGFALLVRRITGRTVANPFNRPFWLWVLGALLLAFGVVRNLPAIGAW